MAAVTKRQREVVDFIQSFEGERNYSPSYQEIADGLGLRSIATVHKHIHNLKRKGLVKGDDNRSRAIEVVSRRLPKQLPPPAFTLPLVGIIAAGRPVEALENPETISLGDITRSRGEVYMLEVRGDSMQDEHIIEGDFVMVEKTNVARDGEIVVALVNNSDATLKRIYREGPQVRLQPSNAKMKPIRVPAQNVQVQGRVVGILRRY
ncbi:MAG: transcriptional repressor LexA [Acidobacteriaceae bacterium]